MKVFEDQGTKKKTFAESHLQSKLGGTGRVSAEHCGRCEIIPKQRRCNKKNVAETQSTVSTLSGEERGRGGGVSGVPWRSVVVDLTLSITLGGQKKNFVGSQLQCQRRGTGRVSADLRGRLELIAHSGRGGGEKKPLRYPCTVPSHGVLGGGGSRRSVVGAHLMCQLRVTGRFSAER